ncbi:hypothetical protein ABKN59_000209 [Abortiporus biennis]
MLLLDYSSTPTLPDLQYQPFAEQPIPIQLIPDLVGCFSTGPAHSELHPVSLSDASKHTNRFEHKGKKTTPNSGWTYLVDTAQYLNSKFATHTRNVSTGP